MTDSEIISQLRTLVLYAGRLLDELRKVRTELRYLTELANNNDKDSF